MEQTATAAPTPPTAHAEPHTGFDLGALFRQLWDFAQSAFAGIGAWINGMLGNHGASVGAASPAPGAITAKGGLSALQIAMQSYTGDLKAHPELTLQVTQDPATHAFIYRDRKGDVALSDLSLDGMQQQIKANTLQQTYNKEHCTSATFLCRAKGYARD